MKRIILIAALLISAVLFMAAITAGTGTSATRSNGSTATTLSWAHTCSANDKLLVTIRMNSAATISSVAWGGVTGTQIASVVSTNQKLYVYQIEAGAVSGAKNVTVTTSARCDLACVAESYSGVSYVLTPVTSAFATAKSVTMTGNTLYENSYVFGSAGIALANITGTMAAGGSNVRATGKAAGITVSAMTGDITASILGSYTWIGHMGTTAGSIGGIRIELAAVTLTNTQTVTPTNTLTITQTITSTNTQTKTPTSSPTITITATPTNTQTNTLTVTQTNTPTNSPTMTITQTNSPTLTITPTDSPTLTVTQTITETNTPTATITITATPTITATVTTTNTLTFTPTSTVTMTATITPTEIDSGFDVTYCGAKCKILEWDIYPSDLFYKVYGNNKLYRIVTFSHNASHKQGKFVYYLEWLNVYKESEIRIERITSNVIRTP